MALPSNFSPYRLIIMLSDKHYKWHPWSSAFPFQKPHQHLVCKKNFFIDATCTVSLVPTTPDQLKAVHFSNMFVDIVAGIGSVDNELRVGTSLVPWRKQPVTKRILQVTPTWYHVKDDTDINNLNIVRQKLNLPHTYQTSLWHVIQDQGQSWF